MQIHTERNFQLKCGISNVVSIRVKQWNKNMNLKLSFTHTVGKEDKEKQKLEILEMIVKVEKI